MSHHNALFSQTLSLIPRHVFQKLENRRKTGRSSRKFGFNEQFTEMAFIQLTARRSMRDGLRCSSAAGSRLYHWGLKNVARSTFADANNSRPAAFLKICFTKYTPCAAPKPRNTSFGSKPSCSAWTPPASSSASASFPGLHSVREKAYRDKPVACSVAIRYRSLRLSGSQAGWAECLGGGIGRRA